MKLHQMIREQKRGQLPIKPRPSYQLLQTLVYVIIEIGVVFTNLVLLPSPSPGPIVNDEASLSGCRYNGCARRR